MQVTRHSQGTLQAFKDGWSPLRKEYDALKEHCGGVASAIPGTSLVESNFSLINWTTDDPHLKSLTYFSLESILHNKQCRNLEAVYLVIDSLIERKEVLQSTSVE
jgi:hypothetical protein